MTNTHAERVKPEQAAALMLEELGLGMRCGVLVIFGDAPQDEEVPLDHPPGRPVRGTRSATHLSVELLAAPSRLPTLVGEEGRGAKLVASARPSFFELRFYVIEP